MSYRTSYRTELRAESCGRDVKVLQTCARQVGLGIRIEAALELITAVVEEPRLAATSSRIPQTRPCSTGHARVVSGS